MRSTFACWGAWTYPRPLRHSRTSSRRSGGCGQQRAGSCKRWTISRGYEAMMRLDGYDVTEGRSMTESKNLDYWRQYGDYVLMAMPYADEILVRGEGCKVWDADGRELLDLAA